MSWNKKWLYSKEHYDLSDETAYRIEKKSYQLHTQQMVSI